ncbi:MAG TPA: hypothetical protein VED40_01290 [Azospirillaceae bacterium]|nr:hypothetical protein [Azospirillaceae bacterium]
MSIAAYAWDGPATRDTTRATRAGEHRPALRLTTPLAVPAAAAEAGKDVGALPMRAAPDLPVAVGWMMVGCYGWILGAFWLTFGAGASSAFMVAVSTAYTAMYLGVPYLFLRMEPKRPGDRAPTLAAFLARGMETWTGHCTAGAALGQMFAVPLALGFAASALGIVIAAVR